MTSVADSSYNNIKYDYITICIITSCVPCVCIVLFNFVGLARQRSPLHGRNIILYSMGPRSAINSLNIYDILLSRWTPIYATKNNSRRSAIALRSRAGCTIILLFITEDALRRMLRMPTYNRKKIMSGPMSIEAVPAHDAMYTIYYY